MDDFVKCINSFLGRQIVHVLSGLLGIPHQLAFLLSGWWLALIHLPLPVLLVLRLMDVWLRAACEMAVPLVLMLMWILWRCLLATIKRAGRFAGQTALAAVTRESRTTACMRGALIVPIAA